MTLATLSEAIDWVERRWAERLPPSKLHDPTQTEGELGGLPFTAAMTRYLDATPNQTHEATQTVTCHHPTLYGRDPKDCRECYGTCVKSATRLVYRWPMWRAVTKLQNSLQPRNQPHPYGLVVVLAGRNWDARATAVTLVLPWDYFEAAMLRALRQLHGRYEEGPVDTRRSASSAGGAVGWLTMSESNRNAIVAGETAA